MYSAHNELFGEVHHFELCEGEQCKIIMMLGFATGPRHKRVARQSIMSHHDENNYGLQQMLNAQCIKMSINGASTICGVVNTVILLGLGHCYS